METLLRYEHVDIAYLGQPAVEDVSFSLSSGEILGIVGESGSGKSTLIKAAMGLLGSEGRVTGGSIRYKGRDLTALPQKELRKLCGPELGYIFQSAGSAFCPIRTVGAQLYEAMREHGKISKAAFEERALEMLTKLGFEDGKRILTSYPFELSGGMQQRVGIAAAMLLKPRRSSCGRADLRAGRDPAEAGGGGNADGAGHLRHRHRPRCPQSGRHRRHGRQRAGAEGRQDRGIRKNRGCSDKSSGRLYQGASCGRAPAPEVKTWNRS